MYVGLLGPFDEQSKEVLRHPELSAYSFPGSALSKYKLIILCLHHAELKLSSSTGLRSNVMSTQGVQGNKSPGKGYIPLQ